MICGAHACTEACLFFSDDLLRQWLQLVQYDLQHDFACLVYEIDHLVVLALLIREGAYIRNVCACLFMCVFGRGVELNVYFELLGGG